MLFRNLQRACRILFITVLLLAYAPPVEAQDNDVFQLLARINALRQQNGLLPLDLSSILTTAAQRHSDDMATTGNIDHNGSDGSTYESRIRDAGYGHWRSFGIWGENIYGGQMADVDAAWNFWIGSQVHRANLLSSRYREIGIGVGRSDKGVFYTLNFGAQPNVLPFFVTGSAPVVALLLTNENDITTGEGVAIMGQATEVRIAEGTDTSSAGWQPWAQSIPFQLSSASGTKTITVEYRDELKRGAKISRTFDVSTLASPTPTSRPSVTPTLKPSATGAAATTPTGTTAPTPTATPQPTETPTPLPTETPPPTSTSTASPTPTPSPEPTATITPMVFPSPTAAATPQVIAANLATLPAGSRLTPPAPRPAPTERALFDSATPAPVGVFAAAIGLQAIALIVIGAVIVARIRRQS